MNPASQVPDHPGPEGLRRFLAGDLPEPDLEQLAGHLEECSACQQALPGRVATDPLLGALRRPLEPEPHANEPECLGAIQRLATTMPLTPETSEKEPAPATQPGKPAGEVSTTMFPTLPGIPRSGAPDPLFSRFPCPFGRYEILKPLGEGGMGAVYLARDTTLDFQVALKVCLKRRNEEEVQSAERFLREARAAADLRHEGICRVLDYGVVEGVSYLTMDYIPGRPLSRLVKEGQPLDQTRAAALVGKIARALEAAHRQGVIHRDLKPANIMLDEQDQPRVVDFGLARRERDETITQPGMVPGTPAYMSPEQVNGEPADARSDIYSLGVILYELLTGCRPYQGDSLSLLFKIAYGQKKSPAAHRPDLDPRLEAICLKALSRSSQDRYPTMSTLAADLEAFLAGSSLPGGEPPCSVAAPTLPFPRPKARRRPRWVAAAALVAALGIGVVAYAVFRPRDGKEGPNVLPPLKGWIDVRVWEKGNKERQGLRLHQDGALPLKVGDTIRVEAKLNRPAYLYVFWIGADGSVQPVYPWKPGHWDERPATERPVAELSLPEDPLGGWEMGAEPPGMETLVMLVRETPLPRDVDLPRLLAGLEPQQMQNPQAAVWFENGAVVHDEGERAPLLFNVKKIDDPVLRTQRLLKDKLGPLGDYSRAVSFANRGK